MFGFGVPELVLILVIGLMVFGADKLPKIGQAFGRSIHEFKTEMIEDSQKSDEIQKEKV